LLVVGALAVELFSVIAKDVRRRRFGERCEQEMVCWASSVRPVRRGSLESFGGSERRLEKRRYS